jgi:hypothetical protein
MKDSILSTRCNSRHQITAMNGTDGFNVAGTMAHIA